MTSVGATSRRHASVAYRCLGFFMGAWLLDYRATEGDQLAPLLQAAGLALSALCILISLSAAKPRRGLARAAASATVMFGAYTVCVGAIRGQAPMSLFTTPLPLLLCAGAIILVSEALATAEDPQRVARLVLALSVASMMLKPVTYYYSSGDLSLENVRYQIISGSMLMVMGYCVTALFTQPRWRDATIMVLVVAILGASVTRTYLLVGAVMIAAVVVTSASVLRGRMVRAAAIAVAAVLAIYAFAPDAFDMVVDRWEARVENAEELGFDLTAASRVAEVTYQFDTITDSIDLGLFGNGIAAHTEPAGEAADLFLSVLPDYELTSIGFGHNGQASILFVGGWIIGGGFLLVTLSWVLKSFRFLRRYTRGAHRETPEFIGSWAATTVIGTMAATVFGGIFVDRSESVHLGVALGMLLWAHERLSPPKIERVPVPTVAAEPMP